MTKTYVVLNTVDITNEMFEYCQESEGTFRMSIDESQAILTFDVEHPDHMAGKIKYTKEEMLTYLAENSESWVSS